MKIHDDFNFLEIEQSDFRESDDIVRMLEQLPGIDDDLPARKQAAAQMEREYRLGLAALRNVVSLTQAEVAARLGNTQGNVARMDGRADMLLSTLNNYLAALGAEATLSIKVGGTTVTTGLAEVLHRQ